MTHTRNLTYQKIDSIIVSRAQHQTYQEIKKQFGFSNDTIFFYTTREFLLEYCSKLIRTISIYNRELEIKRSPRFLMSSFLIGLGIGILSAIIIL